MITIEIDKTSQRLYEQSIKEYGKKAEKAIQNAIVKACLSVETIAKQRLSGMMGSAKHIITNRLRASVHTELKGMNTFKRDKSSESNDSKLGVELKDLEGVVGTNVDYAEAIENGFAPHVITPKKAKVLAFKKDGKMIFARKVNHPGFRGESFLRYAAEMEEKNLPGRIETELNKL